MAVWDRLFPKKIEEKESEKTFVRMVSGEILDVERISHAAELTYARKPPLKLEQLYWSDPIIFNGINTWVELICSPSYSIVGNDEGARKYIEDFLEKIEFEDEILPKITQHICIYGNAYSEILFNRSGSEIVDLTDPIDPKTMDFMKDRLGIPLQDEYGNPTLYRQMVPTGKPLEIPADHIIHFRLYSIAASQLGIGFIEPLYWTGVGKRNLDEKIAQQEFRRANPLAVVKVGDEKHPPSAEEINDISSNMKDITYKTDFVVPHWYDLQFIEVPSNESSINSSKYFVDQEIAGLGLPKAFVLGTGEAQNRATLELIVALTQKKVQRIQKLISNYMENRLFKKIVELKSFREAPKMIWHEFSPESLTNKIDRLSKEIQIGLVVPDEDLKHVVRKWENLPVVERTSEDLGDSHASTKES